MPIAFWVMKVCFLGMFAKHEKLDTFVLIKAQNLNAKNQTGFWPNKDANQMSPVPAHRFSRNLEVPNVQLQR